MASTLRQEHLTPLDLLMPGTYIRAVFTFQTTNSVSSIAKSLQQGLDSLVHDLPWLSGQVLPPIQAPGEKPGLMLQWEADATAPQILNKGKIGASYSDLASRGMPPDAIPAHVWPVSDMIDHALFEAGPPVFASSLFQFGSDQAVGLCICIHHNVVDATGYAEIIKLWARSMPGGGSSASPTLASSLITPAHDSNRTSQLSAALSPFLEAASTKSPEDLFAAHSEYSPNPPAFPSNFPRSVSRIFTIPIARINAIKQALGPNRRSTNTIVSALLWKAITSARVRASSPSSSPQARATTRFTTAVNGRPLFSSHSPSQEPYLGNAVLYATTELPSSTIASSSSPSSSDEANSKLGPICSAIAQSITNVDTRYVAEAHALASKVPDHRAIFPGWDLFGSRDVTVTSWADLGFYDGDGDDEGEGKGIKGFGLGRPDFVRVPGAAAMADGVAIVLPRRRGGEEKGVDVLVMLWEETMEELVKEGMLDWTVRE